MRFIDLNNHGLRVLNFEHIFIDAYKHIVNDLFMYDKHHDLNIRSQDTKRIYYYHMIKHVCDAVVSSGSNNRIIVYYSEKDIKCDFKQCANSRTRKGIRKDTQPEFRLFMTRFFKQVKTVLPIKVFQSPVKFNTFVQYYNTNKGKYMELINMMKQSKPVPSNMEKFKKFTSKYKLNYLDKHYVNNVKIKCMMYK